MLRRGKASDLWLVVLAVGTVAIAAAAVRGTHQPPQGQVATTSHPTQSVTSAPTTQRERPLKAEARVSTDDKGDGRLRAMDTGQALSNFGNHPLFVAKGALTHDVEQRQNAGYIQYEATRDVTQVEAGVAWAPGARGAVAIVIPSAPWADGTLPAAGIHLVVYGNGQWHISRWAKGEDIYASGRFADVRDGEVRDLKLDIDHAKSRVAITFPDGSTKTVSDPHIATECGRWVIWELYETDGVEAPASIHRLAVGVS